MQAPGGLAPLSATAAVLAGAASVQASAGPVALVSARPSAETLRAALVGGERHLDCQPTALDRAARVVGPMLPADRLRQAAAAVFGPAVAVPPALEPGLISRLGRLGLSRSLVAVATESAAVARDIGGATLAYPLGAAILSQAAGHVIEGRRWAEIEPELAQVALGRAGRLRGPVAPAALEAARAADPGAPPLRDLAAVSEEAPQGLSEEDLVLWAMFAEATEPVVARRRSLGAEAANRPGPAGDRPRPAGHAGRRRRGLRRGRGERRDLGRPRDRPPRRAGRRPGPPRPAEAHPTPRPRTPTRAWCGSTARWWAPSTAAPGPTSRPSSRSGQRIEAGETLCLIEAMKLFNEIVAEQGGVVRSIALEDAAPAEFGQLLFLIEP